MTTRIPRIRDDRTEYGTYYHLMNRVPGTAADRPLSDVDKEKFVELLLRLGRPALGRRLTVFLQVAHASWDMRLYGDPMKKTIQLFSALMLVLAAGFTASAAEGDKKFAFKVVLPEAKKDPAAFIRNHRVALGRDFYESKETKTSWQGMLGYPRYNNRPLSWTPFADPIEIIKTPELKGWDPEQRPGLTVLELDELNHGYNLLLLEDDDQPDKYRVLAYLAARTDDPKASWMPVTADLYDNPELRYSRILAEAVADLSSPKRTARVTGLHMLAVLNKEALPHVPKIATLLSDAEDPVVTAAVRTLGVIGGPDAEATIPQLIKLLGADYSTRFAAVRTLGRLGPKSKAAVPQLIELMKAEEHPISRVTYLKALGSIAPGDPRVKEVAAPYLDNFYEETRRLARIASGTKKAK